MEISIPVDTEKVVKTGANELVDSTKKYNQNEQFTVNHDDEFQDDNKIYV